ncbi:zinc metalloproteinase-disintegrin-like bothrojarin-1 [Microcaecilia unicolor]|uniref:Zinc metalloproteinase-disintegrin-like bothrojarin-1 n=1 Tax=Microcaecilia unicolor TaxID=1415580 RepID=A0A6P7Y5I4_9AMPH|nr:zinc metalloproteinase-disintegrin-like bothrojarin-1 [Microcaecilia unicolor]
MHSALPHYREFLGLDKEARRRIRVHQEQAITRRHKINTIVWNCILELGEECDCGGPEECTNPCCDPKTCTLIGESKCAQGECCENCKLKSAGSVCRPSVEECDLTDVCDGQSAWCPADKFRQNGSPCKNNQSYCYMGKCPTMHDQCVAEWGEDAEVAKIHCFTLNTKGFQYGYCSKNATNFIPCTRKDMECGKLFCTGGNKLPKTGNAASIRSCKTSFHPSLKTGIVETGTKCGNEEVCSNSTCLGVSEAYSFDPDCSKKCKGNAVCNNEQECQCEEGWASPDCDKPLIP